MAVHIGDLVGMTEILTTMLEVDQMNDEEIGEILETIDYIVYYGMILKHFLL